MNVDLEARHGAEGATLELAVSAPIMNLTWLKSIDFGFREHLQHIFRRAPITVSSLLRLFHPKHVFQTPNAKTCRAVVPP
jgi:hypothetical protein